MPPPHPQRGLPDISKTLLAFFRNIVGNIFQKALDERKRVCYNMQVG